MFAISVDGHEVGVALSVPGSYFSHSCAPNLAFSGAVSPGQPVRLLFRATRDAKRGDLATVPYIDPFGRCETIRQRLLEGYHFKCTYATALPPRGDLAQAVRVYHQSLRPFSVLAAASTVASLAAPAHCSARSSAQSALAPCPQHGSTIHPSLRPVWCTGPAVDFLLLETVSQTQRALAFLRCGVPVLGCDSRGDSSGGCRAVPC